MGKLRGILIKILAAAVLFSSSGLTEAFAAVNYTGRYISIKKNTQLITNTKSKTLDERYAVTGKKYKILQDISGYYKIKIGKVTGYVPKGNTTLLKIPPRDKLVLAWNYINAAVNNKYQYDNTNDMLRKSSINYGIDAISPTWFDMSGDSSKPVLMDKGDREYVKVAHRNGYEVWPRFAEMNKNRATALFTNKALRTKVINDIVMKARNYNVDGINIDFEALGSSNKANFTSFTRDLSVQLKKYGINVSVDVTKPVPGSDLYSACYDRASLAKYADYVVFMGYDQNTASSVGPVGSYDWVEDGIKKIIASGVPRQKLILAVPFYMRDYAVKDSNTQTIAFNAAGKIYKTPYKVDNNKIGDGKRGNVLKIIGTLDSGWIMVEYNHQNAFVKSSNIIIQPSNTPYIPSSDKPDILFSEDMVVAREDTSLYLSSNEAESNKIMDIGSGNPLKYIGKTNDGNWYIVDKDGTEAYMPASKGDYLPSNTAIATVNSNNRILLTFDAAVLQRDCTIYENPVEIEDNILLRTNKGDYFKMISEDGDLYKVVTDKGTGYAAKTDAAVNSSKSNIVSSTAISMTTVSKTITQHNAKEVYDSKLKQSIIKYTLNGINHTIYLEDKTTISWRADLINKYGLGGMAIWQLDFTPTNDIWSIIRTKMD